MEHPRTPECCPGGLFTPILVLYVDTQPPSRPPTTFNPALEGHQDGKGEPEEQEGASLGGSPPVPLG